MLSANAAADVIGINPGSLRTLIRLGYVQASRQGRTYQIEQSEVERLTSTKCVKRPHPPALVVAIKASRRDRDTTDPRTHLGWTPGLDPFDQKQLDAVTRWWAVSTPAEPEVLVVTKFGWILHAYEIDGDPVQDKDGHRWSFPVLRRPTAKTKPFLGRRLPPKPGNESYLLPARSS